MQYIYFTGVPGISRAPSGREHRRHETPSKTKYVTMKNPAAVFGILFFLVRMFGITALYRRYFTHHAFEANRFFSFRRSGLFSHAEGASLVGRYAPGLNCSRCFES
jgi:hypothetical protein